MSLGRPLIDRAGCRDPDRVAIRGDVRRDGDELSCARLDGAGVARVRAVAGAPVTTRPGKPSVKSATPRVSIRAAVPDDVGLLYAMIVELAIYERAPDAVTGSEEMLARALFGPSRCAEALVAEVGGEPAGFALFHGTFSTWEVLPGIWLEDLYVRERFRGAGAGLGLLRRLAALTVERGCARLEWQVLDWNRPALGFYERLGASRLPEWERHRLSGTALQALAGE